MSDKDDEDFDAANRPVAPIKPHEPRDEFLKLVDLDLNRMNLPTEFWTTKLSDFAPDAVVSNAEGKDYTVAQFFKSLLSNMAVLRRKGFGPLVCGDSGVGKTALAAMILKEARRRRYTTYFAMIWDLRDCIESRVMFDVDTTIMSRCREVDFLVLDGLEDEPRFQKTLPVAELERLVIWRGQQGKVTIVTTRTLPDAFDSTKKLDGFLRGTSAYLTPVLLTGSGANSKRETEMMNSIFDGGD